MTIQVDSSDPEVRRLVGIIADCVTGSGGYIHPELVVHHHEGSLWTTLPRSANPHLTDEDGAALDRPHPDAAPLMIIPDEIHIPVTDLGWEPSDTRLRYRGSTEHLSEPQRTILAAMVDLFNAVDKVRLVGQAYPNQALQRDEALLGQHPRLIKWSIRGYATGWSRGRRGRSGTSCR